MYKRQIDLAVLAGAVAVELASGIMLGGRGVIVALVVVVLGVVAGFTLASPVRAALFTLVVASVIVLVYASLSPLLLSSAAVIAAASAFVLRGRPTVVRAVSRITTGGEVLRPGVSAWAFIFAPLAAAGLLWLAILVHIEPGELLGLSGMWRHLVTGLSVVAIFLLAPTLVLWRARVASIPRLRAGIWAAISGGMVLLWGLVIFVVVYALNPFPGG
jgi:hypothetical protein